MDEHMGVGWIHAKANDGLRLRALLRRLAEDEGIVWHEVARELPAFEEPNFPADGAVFGEQGRALYAPWEKIVERLDRAEPGTYVLVSHPAHDTEETRRVAFSGAIAGVMAEERARDRALLLSQDLRRALETRGIRCIRYDEV
jgi:hypothetical protein